MPKNQTNFFDDRFKKGMRKFEELLTDEICRLNRLIPKNYSYGGSKNTVGVPIFTRSRTSCTALIFGYSKTLKFVSDHFHYGNTLENLIEEMRVQIYDNKVE